MTAQHRPVRGIALWTGLCLAAALVPAAAQPPYGQPGLQSPYAGGGPQDALPPQQGPVGQGMPVGPLPAYSGPQSYPEARPEALVPRDPSLERRAPQPEPANPLALTPEEQAELDWVLKRWEQHGAKVKTFECKFTRFDWEPVWRPDRPLHIVQGEIRYAAPDKGMFRVDGEIVDYQWDRDKAVGGRFVKGQQAEHWICDGKSVFEYDFQKKQLIQHKLPPELQGKAIADSPLPFLFSSTAAQLNSRYFLRIVTPEGVKDQVWLEAYPKYQGDAANFLQATLILTLDDMQPSAMQTVLPNGKSRTVYQFHKPRVNVTNLLDPLGVFDNNWLHAVTPPGWTKIVEEAPPSQAGRTPPPQMMR